MRLAVLGLVMLISLPIASSSMQAGSHAQARPFVRDPHSTRADLAIPLCPAKFDDSLETNGIVSGHERGVTLPKATFTPQAKLTDEARKAAKANRSMTTFVTISATVDEKGNTNGLCILTSAGYGLDASAAKTASQYKFEPARIGDKTVPYRLSIYVAFRIY